MGVAATSILPFIGTVWRIPPTSENRRQCLVTSPSTTTVGRPVQQAGGVALHATNAVLVFFIAVKVLEQRRVEDRHVRRLCGFLATAVLFGPHSLRNAMLGDVTGQTLLFLAATALALGGVYMRVADGVRGRMHPSVASSVALAAGAVLAASVLLSVAAPQQSPWARGWGWAFRLDSNSIGAGAGYYGEGYLTSATPLESGTTTAGTATKPNTSIKGLLAVSSAALAFVWATAAAVYSRVRTSWMSVRAADAAWSLTVSSLKVLQSALNVLKAQVFFPVNVDKGYVQLQLSALEALLDAGSWSPAAVGRRIACGARALSLSSTAAFVLNLPGELVGAMPLFELMGTVALLICVGATVTRQLLRRRKTWPFGARITGAAKVAMITVLSCSAVGLAPHDSSSADTTLLSLQSYVPSALLSVCLGEHLATHVTCILSLSNSHISVITITAAVLADAWSAHPLKVVAAEKSLVVSFTEALQGRAAPDCKVPRVLQLLSIAAVTIVADTIYKSANSEPSKCFFRSTATRSLEFVCC